MKERAVFLVVAAPAAGTAAAVAFPPASAICTGTQPPNGPAPGRGLVCDDRGRWEWGGIGGRAYEQHCCSGPCRHLPCQLLSRCRFGRRRPWRREAMNHISITLNGRVEEWEEDWTLTKS